MYGVAGERRLTEYELDWLAGYEGSRPVRVGNAASGQLQLDVYGEVLDAMDVARGLGIEPDDAAWRIQRHIMDWLESNWREPDEGIWEVRGARRHFTHSKVMAWVAADRAVRAVEESGLDGDARLAGGACATEIHEEVCREGYDAAAARSRSPTARTALDASLLLIPQVGFLPASDPRVAGTVEAIQRELCRDGLVLRYVPDADAADGLPRARAPSCPAASGSSTTLPCSGAHDEAHDALRAPARAAQRRRPALGGVRRGFRSPRGQLPPGLLPPRAGRQCLRTGGNVAGVGGMSPCWGRLVEASDAAEQKKDRQAKEPRSSDRRQPAAGADPALKPAQDDAGTGSKDGTCRERTGGC